MRDPRTEAARCEQDHYAQVCGARIRAMIADFTLNSRTRTFPASWRSSMDRSPAGRVTKSRCPSLSLEQSGRLLHISAHPVVVNDLVLHWYIGNTRLSANPLSQTKSLANVGSG